MAFLRCWYLIFSAVRSNRSLLALFPNDQDCIKAAAAVRTWQTVNSGFFPPLLPHAFQEQVRDCRQRLVADKPSIFSSFVMIESQFGFARPQNNVPRANERRRPTATSAPGVGRSIADKVLDFLRLQNITHHEQMTGLAGVAVLPLWVESHLFDFPHHWSFLAVLDAEGCHGWSRRAGL